MRQKRGEEGAREKRSATRLCISTKFRRKTPNFREEIIAEILFRLHVKSLLRFLSVSLSWRRLISNHHFRDSHFQISTKGMIFTRRRLITTVQLQFYTLKHCSLHSLIAGAKVYGS
ncbi:F-box/kelch-repeat protein-like protein [Salvia divinorum]|uniref:F-box/kelch-repeat protein-like protein n=1 Tax=Salvia divinorum TaxID=28513 RepID=A0ABD1IPJ7_SALDI